MSPAEAKRAARAAALARRASAHAAGHPDPTALLREALRPFAGMPLAAYLAMRSEIDPLPAVAGWDGPLGLPVVLGSGLPLGFRLWRPGEPLAPGGFGTEVPAGGALMEPAVLVVPLLAFTRVGGRLGYGGGFYDRTLAALRARGPVTAVGFAWDAQEAPDLPLEATDAPLDMVVTPLEIIRP